MILDKKIIIGSGLSGPLLAIYLSKRGYFVDWQWIFFEYNWRDVPQGLKMAQQNNINFISVTSHRWLMNDPLRPPYEVLKCKNVFEVIGLIESGFDG